MCAEDSFEFNDDESPFTDDPSKFYDPFRMALGLPEGASEMGN